MPHRRIWRPMRPRLATTSPAARSTSCRRLDRCDRRQRRALATRSVRAPAVAAAISHRPTIVLEFGEHAAPRDWGEVMFEKHGKTRAIPRFGDGANDRSGARDRLHRARICPAGAGRRFRSPMSRVVPKPRNRARLVWRSPCLRPAQGRINALIAIYCGGY